MPLSNCSKCNRLFQQTLNLLCPACHQEAMIRTSVVYEFLQSHPPQTLESVAAAFNLPIKELEGLLYSGKLGTAANKIICHCQACQKVLPLNGSKGRFCPDCALKLENKQSGLGKNPTLSDKTITRHKSTQEAVTSSSSADMQAVSPAESTHPIAGIAPQNEESASPLGETYGFTRFSKM